MKLISERIHNVEDKKPPQKKEKSKTITRYKRLEVGIGELDNNVNQGDEKVKSTPVVESGGLSYKLPDAIVNMATEKFKTLISSYFRQAGSRTVEKTKNAGNNIIIEIPVPYSLDDLCMVVGMTKNELFAYASMSVRRTRIIEWAVMKITSSLTNGALTGIYPADFVHKSLKVLDDFWGEGKRGAMSTMKPESTDRIGALAKGFNITMITVKDKKELSNVKNKLGIKDEAVDVDVIDTKESKE